jgi:hypothetical protein
MRTALLAALGLVLAAPLAGQEEEEPQYFWGASYYPFPLKGPNDQLSVALIYHFAQPADYYDRVAFARSLSFEGRANASGSRMLVARFKAPRLARGWRLQVEAGAVRENRYGYFGLGNETEETEDPPSENRWIDRVSRTRLYAKAEVTRHVTGRLHLAVAGSMTDAQFRRLPGLTKFAADFPQEPGDVDFLGQVRLVVDTRDNEIVPSRGFFGEAGVEIGSAGPGYTGVYGIANGLFPPWEGAVIAGRLLGRTIQSDAPLDARSTLHAWERAIPLLGGPESHRAFVYGRYTGRQVLLGNLEFRQDILNFGDYGAFTGLAFIDAGMVQEVPELEANTWHFGGGVGLAMRILRSTVLQFNFAMGGDGFQFSMGTGWAF